MLFFLRQLFMTRARVCVGARARARANVLNISCRLCVSVLRVDVYSEHFC